MAIYETDKTKENNDQTELTPEEKKRLLYEKQVALLDTFLAHHAISKAQYDKSYGDLTEKMGYGDSTEKRDAAI